MHPPIEHRLVPPETVTVATTVFVLLKYCDYEDGVIVIGVFSTEELAKKAAAETNKATQPSLSLWEIRLDEVYPVGIPC